MYYIKISSSGTENNDTIISIYLHEVSLALKGVKHYLFLVIPQKSSRSHGEMLSLAISLPLRVTDLRLTFAFRFQVHSDDLHRFGFACIIRKYNSH
jgi:hypothetical protein